MPYKAPTFQSVYTLTICKKKKLKCLLFNNLRAFYNFNSKCQNQKKHFCIPC